MKRSLALLAFCLAGFPLHSLALPSAPAATASAANYEALMQESGFSQHAEQVPDVIVMGLEQGLRDSASDPVSLALLKAEAAHAFNPQNFRSRVLARLKGSLTAADAEAVLQWLRSPQGREITALEVAAGEKEAQAALYAAMQSPPALAPEREASLRALDETAGISAYGVRVNERVVMVLARLTANSNPQQKDAILKQAHAALEQMRPAAEAQAEQQNRVILGYTYRDLPEEKLRAYLDFNQSPAAQHYNKAMMDAELAAIEDASRDFFRALLRRAQAEAKGK